MDRVTAFKIVVTHNPGEANAASVFLSRLQSNSNETIELKLRHRILIRGIEIDVRAKLPDNTINELFPDDLPVHLLQVLDINTLITPKRSGKYYQALHQINALTAHWELHVTKYKKKNNGN